MPDPIRIVIEVDNTKAKAAIAETNKALDGITDSSTRSAKNTGDVFGRMASQITQSVKSIGGASGTNSNMFRSIQESAQLAGTGASNAMRGMAESIKASFSGLNSVNGNFLGISSGAEAAAAKASSAMAAAAAKMKADIAGVSGNIVVNAQIRTTAQGQPATGGVFSEGSSMVGAMAASSRGKDFGRDIALLQNSINISKQEQAAILNLNEEARKVLSTAKSSGNGQWNGDGWWIGPEKLTAHGRQIQGDPGSFNSGGLSRPNPSSPTSPNPYNGGYFASGSTRPDAMSTKAPVAEQEALAGATNAAGESMAGSMVKGMIYFEALSKGIEIIKGVTFESAKYAAQTKMFETAMYAVALANGVSAKSAKEAEQAMRKLNIGAQEARMSVSRMIQAGIPLEHAGKIADMGRNLAISVPGMTSSDVTANIVRGVQTGETENLRTLGINVNFERAYQQYAKAHHEATGALTEEERMTARLTTVLKEHNKTAGMYEAAMGDVGKQMSSLPRLIDDAKNAIGDKLIPALGLIVTTASWVLEQISKNPTVAKSATLLGGTAAGAAVGAGVGALFGGIGAVPGAAIGGGVGFVAAGASIVYDNMTGPARHAKEEAARKAAEDQNLAGNAASLKKSHEDEKTLALQQKAAELAKKTGEDYKKTVESLRESVAKAQAEELTGYKKLNAEHDNELMKLERKHELTRLTLGLVNQELAAKIRSESKKDAGKFAEGFDAERNLADKNSNSKFQTHLSYSGETDKLDIDSMEKNYDESVKRSIEFSKNMQLENLRAIDSRSLEGKLAVEAKKFAIEQEYLQKSSIAQIDSIRMQTEGQVALLEAQRAASTDDREKSDITQRIATVQEVSARQASSIQDVWLNSSQAAQAATINNQTEIVQAGIEKQFATFKSASAGVFDALLVKSESVWQAMANSLKNAFITVMKEIVTSTVAKQLTNLFTPHSAGAATSGGSMGKARSWWEQLTSAPRAQASQCPSTQSPSQGVTGAPTSFPGSDLFNDYGDDQNLYIDNPSGAMSMAGFGMPTGSMAGTTPPFVAASAGFPYGGGGGMGGMVSQVSQLGGLAKLFKGGGGMSSLWRRLSGRSDGTPGVDGQEGIDNGGTDAAGGGMFSGGVGGLAGTALMAGGGLLAMDGWKRGGGMGMLEMTGGGAAIGWKFGGPMGAAIGAGVGALVGGLHWAFGAGSAEDQMKKHVRELTGVTIDDKSFLTNMVAACKQATGGDVLSFVKSKAGMDMVESYASQTHQKFNNPFNQKQFNMALSGGSVYEPASYTNGSLNSSLSSLPGMGFSDVNMLSSGGASSTTLSLDAAATTAVLTGQAANVITNNPRMVAASNSAALAQNYSTASIGAVGNSTAIKP